MARAGTNQEFALCARQGPAAHRRGRPAHVRRRRRGRSQGLVPADPVPQALVLTAIVINFGIITFVIALAVRACLQLGTDRLAALDDRSEER
jgi:multisubunit Na+/H+ antiporter MnhC subunit